MKSKITATLSALLIFSLLFSTGCGKKGENPDDPTTTEAFLQDDLTTMQMHLHPKETKAKVQQLFPKKARPMFHRMIHPQQQQQQL